MSIVISNMDVPPGCQKCKFFKKHFFIGKGLDYSYSCILGAKDFPMPWIRQMEERASDCPIESIEALEQKSEQGKIVYKPHCGKCGAVINTKVAYNKIVIESYKNLHLPKETIEVFPSRCECCGQAFNMIEILLPEQLSTEYLN